MTRVIPHSFVIGASIHTAPMPVLGGTSVGRDQLSAVVDELRKAVSLTDLVMVSTCNRTEIYASSDDASAQAASGVRQFLLARGESAGLKPEHLMHLTGDDARHHLFRVVCGLDSMILGETEIVGQVQNAFDTAVATKTVSGHFIQLFTSAFRAGKRSRTETGIGQGTTSVASAAVHMAERIVGRLARRRILVVGAGETGTLVVKYLKEREAGIIVANRTLANAEALARTVGAQVASLDEIGQLLASVDVVICATNATTPLITRQMVQATRKKRGDLLHLIDISLPNNIESAAGEIDNVFLSDMNDLKAVVAQSIASRAEEKPRVEAIIREEMAAFEQQQRTLEVGPLIRQLRASYEEIRQMELARYRKKLPPEQLALIDQATRSMMNKLLHWPTLGIRALADDGATRFEKSKWIEELFALNKTASERKNKK